MFNKLFLIFRRYKSSVVMNGLGLSLAFAAFIILIIQIKFEYGYNSCNKNADRVYRAYITFDFSEYGESETERIAVFSRQLIDVLSDASPHITAATMFTDMSWYNNVVTSAIKNSGEKVYFKIDLSQVYPSFVEISDMNIIEGNPDALSVSGNALIPKSLADRVFPDESAVGKLLIEQNITVGGVYEDFPENYQIKNKVFYHEEQITTTPGQQNFHFLLQLDDPENYDNVLEQLNKSFLDYYKENVRYLSGAVDNPVSMTPLTETYFSEIDVGHDFERGSKNNVLIMLAVAILILLIAIINYVNFASATAPIRLKMLNIQRISGAGVGQLRFSIIMESVVIAFASFLMGLFIVFFLSETSFTNLWVADIAINSNLQAVVIVAVIALIVGVLTGLYPAFYMTSFSPITALKGSFIISPKGRVYRLLLVAIQYVISLTLIIVTLFVNLQNKFVHNYDLGYDRSNILLVNVKGDINSSNNELHDALINRAMIKDVAFAENKIGSRDFYQGWSGFVIGGAESDFNVLCVSYNFLDVLGIGISEGRNFRADDMNKGSNLYIFNHITPKTTGEELKLTDKIHGENSEIVGIFDKNVMLQSMYMPEASFCFCLMKGFKSFNFYNYMYIRLEDNADRLAAIEDIKEVFKEIDPTFPVEVEFLDNQINQLYQKEQRIGTLTTIASLLAIFISLIGVFGLVLFEMHFRRKEIGIRRVHGALVKNILTMLNRKYVTIILICFAIAAPIAWYSTSMFLQIFEHRISLSWWVFALALLLVTALTVSIATVCSWKTANDNPVNSIKTE